MLTRRRLLASSVAAHLWAQDAPAQAVIVNVDLVQAPVTVTEGSGRFVNGLEGKDFKLFDNTVMQDIKVDVSFVPISLVVAVQANSTVEPVLGNIKRLGPMLEALVTGDAGEAAIVKFDHQFKVMQDFTNDGRLFKQALERINPGSSTSAMIDAVFEATRMLRRVPQGRRRILLLIAETQDKGSEGRIREALLEAQIHNVTVYSININRAITKLAERMPPPRPMPMPPAARPLPPGAPQTPATAEQVTGWGGAAGNVVPVFVEIMKQVKYLFVPNPLEVLTQYSGGREFSFLTLKNLEQVVSALGEELHSQYLLSYTPNDKVRVQGGWHDIRVEVARSGLKIRTRPGYWRATRPG